MCRVAAAAASAMTMINRVRTTMNEVFCLFALFFIVGISFDKKLLLLYD